MCDFGERNPFDADSVSDSEPLVATQDASGLFAQAFAAGESACASPRSGAHGSRSASSANHGYVDIAERVSVEPEIVMSACQSDVVQQGFPTASRVLKKMLVVMQEKRWGCL